MKNFKNSQTYKNLLDAFSNETQAYAKYQFYAKQAKKEKLNVVGDFFDEIALQEKQHAKIWFSHINNKEIHITIENIKDCLKAEKFESSKYYLEFAETAKNEGYDDLHKLFLLVAKAERGHHDRMEKYLKEINDESLYSSNKNVVWICSVCGHIHTGKTPPDRCPICNHPKEYFRISKK